jgi:hypothetical protein
VRREADHRHLDGCSNVRPDVVYGVLYDVLYDALYDVKGSEIDASSTDPGR